MKIKPSIKKAISSSVATMALCVCFILTQRLSAQSADVFESLQGKTEATASGTLVKSPPDIELLKSKPSRFAVGSVELYTAARIANFSMKSRATDPFGLFQDPDIKPVSKPTSSGITKQQPKGNIARAPLEEIVKKMKVTTIMIKEKSFLSEGQVFKESGVVTLDYQDRTNRLKVMKVEATQILFKDMDTGEEATLKTDVLPAGMNAGGEQIKPAGLVDPNENQPLKLGN
ncbi:MAG: hypothetical protein V4727_13940 [Verrucomicrobiota bacterium]